MQEVLLKEIRTLWSFDIDITTAIDIAHDIDMDIPIASQPKAVQSLAETLPLIWRNVCLPKY